jgi:hypothetical protein
MLTTSGAAASVTGEDPRERGQSLVEFALMLPILLVLLMVAVDGEPPHCPDGSCGAPLGRESGRWWGLSWHMCPNLLWAA